MTKKARWGVSAAIVLLIAGMIAFPKVKKNITASKNASQDAPANQAARRTLSVNAEILDYRALSDKTVSLGSTMPDEEVDLSFESSGKITDIFFTEGSHVKAGQLLAKINDRPLQAQLKKLESQIQLASDRVYRQKTLLEKDAVSQEAYEQVTTEYDKLMADIDLVKANIAQTELRAPFDGIIGLRMVSEGAYASPSTVVAKLTRISPIKIEFSIPENYASDVKKGSQVVFRMDTDGVIQDYKATVYAVESMVDVATRTLKVRAKYPNSDENIIPGRYVSVEVNRGEIKDAIAVPSEAVIPEMGRQIIYLYKNGAAVPQEIILGIRTDSHVQVTRGLEKGDTILVSGVMQLRTGMKVNIENLTKESGN